MQDLAQQLIKQVITKQFEGALASEKAKEFESYAKQFVSGEISGTPIFIVSGKYIVYDFQNMNSIVDYLIKKQP